MHAGSCDDRSMPNAGLRCLNCDYELTGLVEQRCPECGTVFDPDWMARLRGDLECAATPWEKAPSWRSFVVTLQMSFLRPGQLLGKFPGRCDRRRAREFSFWCYAAAGMVWSSLSVGAFGAEGAMTAGLTMVVVWTACGMTEVSVAYLMSVTCRKTAARERYEFWVSLCYYGSGYFVLLAGWCGVFELLEMRAGGLPRDWEALFIAGGAGIVVWWMAMMTYVLGLNSAGTRRWVCAGVMVVLGSVIPLVAGGVIMVMIVLAEAGVLRNLG